MPPVRGGSASYVTKNGLVNAVAVAKEPPYNSCLFINAQGSCGGVNEYVTADVSEGRAC